MKEKTQKSKTYPNPDYIHQKPQAQILKFYFILSYMASRVFRGFE